VIRASAPSEAPLAAAGRIARDVSRGAAASVDRDNRFAAESIAAVREAGLLGLLVPRDAGGSGARFTVACDIAAILGRECLSTALIWAMHSQQVAIIADHAVRQWRDVLADIAARGVLVASATSEPDKGGALLRARAALRPDGGRVLVDRPSPMVSYGAEAGYCLATMRRAPESAETDVCFVLLERGDGQVTGDWHAMGMRGTQTVAMHFSASVPGDRVLSADIRRVASATAIPAAHLGWTWAWYGAARGALDRFVGLLRSDARERRRCASDLFMAGLAETRLSLDLLESMLLRLTQHYEWIRATAATPAPQEDPDWMIALNGVKVAGSRICCAAVDSLVDLAGMGRGYVQDDTLALERVLRDLRSARLMISNDRLLQLNAKQMLVHDRRVIGGGSVLGEKALHSYLVNE
jgi:acyl-CoA dehydrogenase